MKSKFIKSIIFILIVMLIIISNNFTNSYAKYTLEYEIDVAEVKIY